MIRPVDHVLRCRRWFASARVTRWRDPVSPSPAHRARGRRMPSAPAAVPAGPRWRSER
jgi:hypothetical protein